MPAQAAFGHGIAYTVLKQQHIFLFLHINSDFVLFGPKSKNKNLQPHRFVSGRVRTFLARSDPDPK